MIIMIIILIFINIFIVYLLIMAEVFEGDAEFPQEEVENIIKMAIHNSLNENSYNSKKVNEWTNSIVTTCLKDLQALARPYKYIITCIIMQKNGAGLNTTCSMFWDSTRDGSCKVIDCFNILYILL